MKHKRTEINRLSNPMSTKPPSHRHEVTLKGSRCTPHYLIFLFKGRYGQYLSRGSIAGRVFFR